MDRPLRNWLHLVLPAGFIFSVWFTMKSRVKLEATSVSNEFATETPIINLYGFPFGYIHDKASVSTESMIYVLPLLGNSLIYSSVIMSVAWLFRYTIRNPKRWIEFTVWLVFSLTLALIIFLAGIGDWKWSFPYDSASVIEREVSVGLPIDAAQ